MVTPTRLRSIAALATPRTRARIAAGSEVAVPDRRTQHSFVDDAVEALRPSEGPAVRPVPAAHTLPDDSLPDDALATAILLASRPSLAERARNQPLPADVCRVIRIVAGSPETLTEAARLTGKDPTFIYAAAVFYCEEVLWAEGNDCHRLLGVAPGASREAAAENVRWLAEAWLRHLGGAELEATQLDRVLSAWVEFNAPKPASPSVRQTTTASLFASRLRWQSVAIAAVSLFVLGFVIATGAFTPAPESPMASAQSLQHPLSTRLRAEESSSQVPLVRMADAHPPTLPVSVEARLQPDTSSVARAAGQCVSRECVP